MKLCTLYLGRMEFLRLQLIACQDETELVTSPTPAFLISHPELGLILYDTGNSPFYGTEYTQFIRETYPVVEFISIEDALAKKGFKPSDVDMIILSHLHFDHAGGLKYFRGTRAIKNVVISEADLKNAYYSIATGNSGAYIKSLFDFEDICFKPISETTQLAPDLTLFLQESHTPGVIGLLLNTQSHGNLILTSDTVYLQESFEKRLPPGGDINKTTDEFFQNLDKIRQMQEEHNATLIYGHDYQQLMDWVLKGWVE